MFRSQSVPRCPLVQCLRPCSGSPQLDFQSPRFVLRVRIVDCRLVVHEYEVSEVLDGTSPEV